MNRYLDLLSKRAQRMLLSARIAVVRPDLIGKSFISKVRTYALEEIEQLVKREQAFETVANENGRLPFSELLCEAMEVEAQESKGYYAAQALYYKQLYFDASTNHSLTQADHSEALAELIETRAVLKDAIDSLNAIKFGTARAN